MNERICRGRSGRMFIVRVGGVVGNRSRPRWRVTATDCRTGETFDLPLASEVEHDISALLARAVGPIWHRHMATFLLTRAAELVERGW